MDHHVPNLGCGKVLHVTCFNECQLQHIQNFAPLSKYNLPNQSNIEPGSGNLSWASSTSTWWHLISSCYHTFGNNNLLWWSGIFWLKMEHLNEYKTESHHDMKKRMSIILMDELERRIGQLKGEVAKARLVRASPGLKRALSFLFFGSKEIQ